jgi:hypothetical protein
MLEEVLLAQQHAGAGVVDVEEALQVGEGVGGAQRLDARVGQRHAVARASAKIISGSSVPFDVQVQLGLGHGTQQRGRDGAG